MAKTNKKILILVVEDEKVLVDVLEEKLLKEGFDVIKAADGEEGLHLALADHPDLILLDILMPKVDGMKMLKKLREDSWGAHVNVIIFTNFDDESKVAEGMNINLDNTYQYLVKSNWTLDDLVLKIKETLKLKS